MPLISFIIPAFNASLFIGRCLDSIISLEAELPEFEIIVVDDASSDNTVGIVKSYCIRNQQIKLLCQPENHRQGAARNKGMSLARGKYVFFVDSDDEIAKGVLSAFHLAERNQLEIVAVRFITKGIDSQIEKEGRLPFNQYTIFTGVELQTCFPYWNPGPWSYLYKRAYLNKVNYPFAEDVFYEDCDFVNVHLFHAKKMAYCDECGYITHYNAASVTHTISYIHLADYAILGTRMLRFYESLDDKTSKFAEGIIEGGSYNIMKSYRKMIHLKTCSEVRAFYDRQDAHYDRRLLCIYRKPKYCWTRWTRFCLSHRNLVVAMMWVIIPFYRFLSIFK